MFKYSRILTVIVLGFNISFINADEHKKKYTIQEIIDIGLSTNYQLLSQKKIVESKKFEKNQASKWENPHIGGGIGFKKEPSSIGPTYNAHLNQTIPLPGKISNKKNIKDTELKIAEINYNINEIEIYYEIIYNIYQYLEAIEHQKHLEERKKYYNKTRIYLESRPFVSPQKIAEKNLISIRLQIIEKELTESKTKFVITWNQLNQYLNHDTPIDIEASWFQNGISLNYDNLYKDIISNNLMIRSLDYENIKNKFEKKFVKMEPFSEINISTNYIQEQSNQLERFFTTGISLPIPILNQNIDKVKSIEAKQESIEYEKKYWIKKINVDFENLKTTYENNKKMLSLFSIKKLHESHTKIKYIDNEFSKGLIDLLTYVETDKQLYEYHVSVFDVQLKYIQTYINLLKLASKMDFTTEGE